jgi:hypothetical protein
MNTLYTVLNESTQIYREFLELEYKKYDAILKADIETLDDLVSKEQVFYLKIRGLEQKREHLIETLGFKDKTLKEIIEISNNEQKQILSDIYNELNKLITEVKKINNLSKTLIEVRLHRVDKAMTQLGEKQNTYARNERKNNNVKSLMISKKF